MRIKALRQERGYSQADVWQRLQGEGIDLSLSGYRSYESGRTQRIPREVILALAKVFEVDPAELYGEGQAPITKYVPAKIGRNALLMLDELYRLDKEAFGHFYWNLTDTVAGLKEE